jgi:hypothetical protein
VPHGSHCASALGSGGHIGASSGGLLNVSKIFMMGQSKWLNIYIHGCTPLLINRNNNINLDR